MLLLANAHSQHDALAVSHLLLPRRRCCVLSLKYELSQVPAHPPKRLDTIIYLIALLKTPYADMLIYLQVAEITAKLRKTTMSRDMKTSSTNTST